MDQATGDPECGAAGITIAEIRRRIRYPDGTGTGQERPVRGDHDLNPGMPLATDLRDAAVLVPLVVRPDGLTVIFTRRTAHLAVHAGQISFPGGQVEPGDAGPEAAALRETEEEIGLGRDRVELLGRLDTYITRTGFRVTPVVGLVHPPFRLSPDPEEVAEVFEELLTVFLDPALPRCESRLLFGTQRFFHAFPYREDSIWGATAGMLVNLRQVLGAGPLREVPGREVPGREVPGREVPGTTPTP